MGSLLCHGPYQMAACCCMTRASPNDANNPSLPRSRPVCYRDGMYVLCMVGILHVPDDGLHQGQSPQSLPLGKKWNFPACGPPADAEMRRFWSTQFSLSRSWDHLQSPVRELKLGAARVDSHPEKQTSTCGSKSAPKPPIPIGILSFILTDLLWHSPFSPLFDGQAYGRILQAARRQQLCGWIFKESRW